MGKPDGRSALFLDRTYIDQHLATLRADIITVMDAKFRAIQNNQERIIKLLEGGDEKPKKEETITEAYAWKLEMRRRVDKMVKNYPELYSDFNNVLSRIYRKMRDVYGFVSEQAIKDYKYATGAEKASCLEVISEDEKLRSLFEPILSNLEEDSRREMERRRMAQEAETGKTRQEIIQPLIMARGDKSNFGCNTYTTVAARMRKNRIDFQAYADGYRKEKGIKRKVTNGELIDNIPALKREFAKAVGELLAEQPHTKMPV
ncbi:hypothetical protein ACG0Z4_08810 [Enterocloster aldenensis]|uniref:hypothetical protein n=1 Tax=Enterocloster aldenensis TaxID=358742 RepID=UPI004025FA2A